VVARGEPSSGQREVDGAMMALHPGTDEPFELLHSLVNVRPHVKWTSPSRRDTYIGFVVLAAVALFLFAATHPTNDPWNLLGIAVLFAAMLVSERISVPLPKHAAISIASIPHIMALLLLPTWMAMLVAGGSMVVDQLLGRAQPRKLLFNTASVSLTIGVSAMLADAIGLTRGQIALNEWQHVPAFLLLATTYYGLTNSLVAVVVSLGADRPAHHVFLDNARFVLPAEFAVCGIGGLVTVIWVVSPAWTPLVLFPAVVSQVAFIYVTASKRNQTRLEFVAEASRVLAMSLDQSELSNSVVRLAVPALGDSALLFLARGTDPELVAHATADETGQRTHSASSLPTSRYTWTAQQVIQDGSTRQLSAQSTGVVVPIRSAQRTLGALVVLSSSRPLASEDTAVVEELARRFAVALENARLHAEAQRATRVRDEFLSIAAHELKTPVTSLRGYAQLLMRNAANPDATMLMRALGTINVQSDKLVELTGKLLDVSRIDSGKLRLEPRAVNVAQLVRECVVTARETTELHTLQVHAPQSTMAWIDPLRFEQVLANLLTNAVKYSPSGGEIEVSLEPLGDTSIQLRVRDHGLGIPPDRRERLFDRMYQAHGDGYLSGLGLGLFISRQIVELHGGRIEAQFPADGGTQMCVTLPVGSAPQLRD
jgi:signal transduction histidine kinase